MTTEREDLEVNTAQCVISLSPEIDRVGVTGTADHNIKLLEDTFNVRIILGESLITIEGEPLDVDCASLIIEDLIDQAKDGEYPDAEYVKRSIESRRSDAFSPASLRADTILVSKNRAIHPKTPGQKRYVDAIRNNEITFGIGPAGTGKTYLAMAMAISALQDGLVSKVVLSRPVLEAGENMGFLPGTVDEKIDPYMRPLYDSLFDMMDGHKAQALLESKTIDVAPLAFMRGRTLNDSFIILDEAQNTTREQMKMFLTRLGYGSRMVITGDLTQSDLGFKKTGLQDACEVLGGIESIAFCFLRSSDVVRHSLVSKIIAAYEKER